MGGWRVLWVETNPAITIGLVHGFLAIAIRPAMTACRPTVVTLLTKPGGRPRPSRSIAIRVHLGTAKGPGGRSSKYRLRPADGAGPIDLTDAELAAVGYLACLSPRPLVGFGWRRGLRFGGWLWGIVELHQRRAERNEPRGVGNLSSSMVRRMAAVRSERDLRHKRKQPGGVQPTAEAARDARRFSLWRRLWTCPPS